MDKILLRKANSSDIEFLRYLRNRPDVYKYFKKARPVSWKEHVDWIMPIILGISNKELFIIRNLKNPIGQIRFDYINQREAEISISILKEFRGKNIAIKALSLALKKQKKAKEIIAEINKDNIASIKLFERLGFKIKTKKGTWLKYILEI